MVRRVSLVVLYSAPNKELSLLVFAVLFVDFGFVVYMFLPLCIWFLGYQKYGTTTSFEKHEKSTKGMVGSARYS